MLRILVVLVLFGIQNGDSKTSKYNELQKLKSYESDTSLSLEMEKADKFLITAWTERFQVQQVNFTAGYRVQMMRHRDHSFGTNVSKKWEDCISTHKRRLNKIEQDYNERESKCLETTSISGEEKILGARQLEKEIKKWRKGYRYLVRLCNSNSFQKTEFASCLVEYVEKDSYHLTLKRLILLKIKAMAELLFQFNNSLMDLEECLRISLSEYLTNVRLTMKVLDRCYTGRKNK